ncbi:endoplasmic reticulum-Golgi intermediate compartment family protein [Aspergillus undulatus]|uniref:endoplasmic reticulum-Golgi intermediate compartment family protein n=1 Tax=Aspergillus undulatus TaxID=1810928 RepID=UPI003CCCDBE9
MNGFASHGLDEDAFGEKSTLKGGLQTFDAFPKTKPSYTTPSRRGGQWTVLILAICTILSLTEFRTWLKGTEAHHFTVEKGVSHDLQLNLDAVIHMPCDTLHINIQDAAGDRVLASQMLTKEPTSWSLWMEKRNYEAHAGGREYQTLSQENERRIKDQEMDAHARHVLSELRRNPNRKFPKGPKLRRGEQVDSCRVYGSLEGNKVQGDFHITARGHGYQDGMKHLDHGAAFNFSHMITELSFGPHYPTILNPLDKTIATTESHYYKYQYFLSVVPTIYSRNQNLALDNLPTSTSSKHSNKNLIFTNQYAATSQSDALPESPYLIPGIFFKYNIEPILLLISEERTGFLNLVIRLVNVVSGVIVTGGWLYQITSWLGELRKRRSGRSEGYLHGKVTEE